IDLYGILGLNIASYKVEYDGPALAGFSASASDTEIGLNLGLGANLPVSNDSIRPLAELTYVISAFDQLAIFAGVKFILPQAVGWLRHHNEGQGDILCPLFFSLILPFSWEISSALSQSAPPVPAGPDPDAYWPSPQLPRLFSLIFLCTPGVQPNLPGTTASTSATDPFSPDHQQAFLPACPDRRCV